MKRKKSNGKVRLNLRLPADLLQWSKNFAEENKTSVTQILINHLMDLKSKTESGQVEQF